jgi:hypothetical protein
MFKKAFVSKRHYLHAAALRGKVLWALAPYKYDLGLTAPEDAGSDELGPVTAWVMLPFIWLRDDWRVPLFYENPCFIGGSSLQTLMELDTF